MRYAHTLHRPISFFPLLFSFLFRFLFYFILFYSISPFLVFFFFFVRVFIHTTVHARVQLLHNELIPELPFVLKAKMAYQASKGLYFLHSSGTPLPIRPDPCSPRIFAPLFSFPFP